MFVILKKKEKKEKKKRYFEKKSLKNGKVPLGVPTFKL